MTVPARKMPKINYFAGGLAASIGIAFVLLGFELLPFSPVRSERDAPLWVLACAGFAFFFGGTAVIVQGLNGANERGELPPGSPGWLAALQYFLVLSIFVCFGVIASWVAFGSGPRAFSGNVMFFSQDINVIVGRAVFGLAALLIWAVTLFLLVGGLRRLSVPKE